MKKYWIIILFLNLIIPYIGSAQEDTLQKRPTVGLVLSGGGAKGFAYVGLLKAIQQAKLPIDYIGGTSIGSIMGGLYAIGYSPETIEEIIRAQNWGDLLIDRIDRKYIAYEEKEFGEKSIVTLPFKSKKISLSSSLYKGQEIDLLLNRYFSPAYNIKDFNKLHTPFLCMGTDLITGEAVELRSGNLAKAIRASMSIPGYFTPVEYHGRYLCDGGVVNNFPVRNVKEMGADIIISGDVQPGLRQTPEELSTITSILDQILTFSREESNKIAYEETDLLIPLDNPYSIMDFEKYDSLIAFGERVAIKYYEQIKGLSDSLNAIEYKPMKPYVTQPFDSVEIKDIFFKGFMRIPLQYFTSNWKDMVGQRVAITDIEEAVRLMYGTRFFERVYYGFDPEEGEQVNLIVEVKEAEPGEVAAALHYDNNYSGSIMINATLRNMFGKRSKLFADLVLGPNPRLRTLYITDNGQRMGFGTMIDFYKFQFDLYDQSVKINKIDFTNFKFSVFGHRVLNNLYRWRLGVDYEYFKFNQEVVSNPDLEIYAVFSGYGTLFTQFNADTRDNNRFPNNGFLAEARVEYVIPFDKNLFQQVFDNSLVAYVNYEHNIPIKQRWVFRPGIFAGGTITNSSVPYQHAFAFGGLNPKNYISSFIAFPGVSFFQRIGYYAVAVKAHLQYNLIKKIYLTALLDVGSNTIELDDLFASRSWICGYGISAGYDSFIGPIQLTLTGSNIHEDPMIFLNLGYWF
jgi:NTE family protein